MLQQIKAYLFYLFIHSPRSSSASVLLIPSWVGMRLNFLCCPIFRFIYMLPKLKLYMPYLLDCIQPKTVLFIYHRPPHRIFFPQISLVYTVTNLGIIIIMSLIKIKHMAHFLNIFCRIAVSTVNKFLLLQLNWLVSANCADFSVE